MVMNARYKRWVIFGFRALVSAGLIYYLINIVDWPRVKVVLGAANPYLVLLTIPISLLTIGGMAFRWKVLLAAMGTQISLIRLFGYYLVGNCFNIFLPGVIGGDVMRMTCLARSSGKQVSTMTGIVILERICGLIALFAMGTAISYLVDPNVRSELGDPLIRLFRLTGLVLICLAIAVRYGAARTRHLQTLGDNLIMRSLSQIGAPLSSIKNTTLSAVLALSALAQALDLIVAFVLARALGIDLSLGIFFIVIPMTYLVTLVPVSLGGVGVREGIFSYLLTRVGVLATDAVTLAFLIYLIRVFTGTLGGIWYLGGIKKGPKSMI